MSSMMSLSMLKKRKLTKSRVDFPASGSQDEECLCPCSLQFQYVTLVKALQACDKRCLHQLQCGSNGADEKQRVCYLFQRSTGVMLLSIPPDSIAVCRPEKSPPEIKFTHEQYHLQRSRTGECKKNNKVESVVLPAKALLHARIQNTYLRYIDRSHRNKPRFARQSLNNMLFLKSYLLCGKQYNCSENTASVLHRFGIPYYHNFPVHWKEYNPSSRSEEANRLIQLIALCFPIKIQEYANAVIVTSEGFLVIL